MVSKLCHGVTLRVILPTLWPISRMAPGTTLMPEHWCNAIWKFWCDVPTVTWRVCLPIWVENLVIIEVDVEFIQLVSTIQACKTTSIVYRWEVFFHQVTLPVKILNKKYEAWWLQVADVSNILRSCVTFMQVTTSTGKFTISLSCYLLLWKYTSYEHEIFVQIDFIV